MITVRSLLSRHIGRLCAFAFAGLLATACRDADPFLQYAAVDLHGWSRDTSFVFTVDSLPGARDYPLSVMLRKSSAAPCPFRSVTLVVRQRWTLAVPDSAAQARTDARRHFRAIGQPRPARCLRDSLLMVRTDTLVADLTADEGRLRARGISVHPYVYPLVTLRLPDGAKGQIVVHHLMRRNEIPGIESVGIRLE